MLTPTTWDVLDVAVLKNGRARGDGDTVSLRRTGVFVLGDQPFQVTDVGHRGIRLVWVDTPEKGEPGYSQADADLDEWISDRAGELVVVCYGPAGWDRVLGDLIDAITGESASQYLMTVKGWPAHKVYGPKP